MVHVQALTDTVIRIGKKEVRPTAPIAFAALLYLCVERGRRVPRAILQELLFPETDERSGAHSLRQLLYKLRQLGVPLDTNANGVLLPAAQVTDDYSAELDVAELRRNGVSVPGSGLLAGFRPALSSEYEEWLQNHKAIVTASIRRQLLSVMGASRDALDWLSVDRVARSVLELDPLNEEATLALAEAAALSGSKREAIDILTRYEADVGHDDLRLPASTLRRRISERPPPIGRNHSNAPFVGRELEADVVRAEVRRARNGSSTAIVVTGEAGIGKTRLLTETSALLALEGTRLFVVNCQPHYATRPLGVFIELVPALISSRGALGAAPESLQQLKRLVKHSGDSDRQTGDARDEAIRSRSLVLALRDLTEAVCSEGTIMLIIEDAHHADLESLRELAALVQDAPTRHLVIVFSTRHVEPLKRAGVLSDSTVIIRMRPLDEASMTDIALHLTAGTELRDDDIHAWCVRQASGNPFFLQILCNHVAHSKEPFVVPPTLVAMIAGRLDQLPRDCRRLLEICAAFGRHATIENIRAIAELTPAQFLNVIERLEEDGFLASRDAAIAIAHDLLRDSALDLLPPLTRKALHGCVAASLQSKYETTHDAGLLWDCAEHWSLSDDVERAVTAIIGCAQHSMEMGHPSQALTILERGQFLAKDGTARVRILAQMMTAAKATNNWPLVSELAAKVSSAPGSAEVLGLHSEIELTSIEATWSTSLQVANMLDTLLRCAIGPQVPTSHKTDAALLAIRIAHECADHRRAEEAYNAVEDILSIADRRYSSRILPIVFHASFGDLSKAESIALALYADMAWLEPAYQFRAAHNIGVALGLAGRLDVAKQIFETFFQKACVLGTPRWEADMAIGMSWLFAITEDFERLLEWHYRSVPVGQRSAGVLNDYRYVAHEIELAIWRNDQQQALQQLIGLRTLVGPGDSLRLRSHLAGLELRVKQMDVTYLSTDTHLAQLLVDFEDTKRLMGADYLAVPLSEELIRRRKIDECRSLLREYFSVRRERVPRPRQLDKYWVSVGGAS